MSCQIDQLSWVTLALVRGTAVSTSSSGPIGPVPDCPCGRPDMPDKSGMYPRPSRVEQISRATPAQFRWPRGWLAPQGDSARVRGPAVSTSTPGRIALASHGPQRRPALPGDWGPGPKASGSITCPVRFAVISQGPSGHQAPPGYSHPCPRARMVIQIYWVTRAWVQGPAVSTSCSWPLGPISNGPRFRPALPGESCTGPIAPG